jgi:hypothetical protein
MDDKTLIKQLSHWFQPWQATEICETVNKHKTIRGATRKDKVGITTQVMEALNTLQKRLSVMEDNYPAVFEKIDQNIRLQRLLELEFKSNYDESINRTLKLLEISIEIHLDGYKKKLSANSMERLDNGEIKYFYTNNHTKDFHLIRELELVWKQAVNIPIAKTEDNDFCRYLALCLYKDESKSGTAKKAYGRFKDGADRWGQKREI